MSILSNLIFIDFKISGDMVTFRTAFWDKFFFLITKLGSWQAIVFLFILISILFFYYKKGSLVPPLFITLAGSGIMTVITKYLVNRIRPAADIAMYAEKGASFPSAHATLVFALFGFLIYCIWQFNLGLKLKICLTAIFTAIILLVGFSRLYLGVHFLTDVIAGYLVGLMWVLIAMYISRKNFNLQ